MSDDTVSHKQILERIEAVETEVKEASRKIDNLKEDTSEVITAFQSAKGAFTVLNWIAGAVKPILWIVGAGAVAVIAIKEFFNKHIGV